jgi:hypothetical protein
VAVMGLRPGEWQDKPLQGARKVQAGIRPEGGFVVSAREAAVSLSLPEQDGRLQHTRVTQTQNGLCRIAAAYNIGLGFSSD